MYNATEETGQLLQMLLLKMGANKATHHGLWPGILNHSQLDGNAEGRAVAIEDHCIFGHDWVSSHSLTPGFTC